MDRVILHCDLNNFYASVECLKHPEWKNVPVAVSGNPEKRHGVILAKNELAKSFGIKTGDVIWQAKQKAPELLLIPPHFDEYMHYSNVAFNIYTKYTCFVEPFGADECWLDCSGSTTMFGSGEKIASLIRNEVYETTGLTLSVGVSFNKVFAKMGSDLKKPDATTVITRENFKDKIWPLPAQDMIMVGKKTAEKLKKLNVFTVGDLAQTSAAILKTQFGINGLKLKEYASGLDSEPVREYVLSRDIDSVGHGMTAVRDIKSYADAESMIYFLSELVASRMRKYGFRGEGISINLRDVHLKHFTRQKKLKVPSFASREIALAAVSLLRENWDLSVPLRTITVSVYALSPMDKEIQMTMFDDKENAKEERLDKTMDLLTLKYGKDTIKRANLIGKDFIYDKTDSEDFLPFKR